MELDVGDRVTILYPDFLRGRKGIIKSFCSPFYTVIYNLNGKTPIAAKEHRPYCDEDFVESEIKLGWD